MSESKINAVVHIAYGPGGEEAYAGGAPMPLALVISRAATSNGSAVLKSLSSGRRDVVLDADLFQGDVEVRPGEVYRLTIPVTAAIPGIVNLNVLGFQVGVAGEYDRLIGLPDRSLVVHPALGREVAVEVESLCTYPQGTKVQVRLRHNGATTFADFAAAFGPEAAVAAGKRRLCRPTFQPGDEDRAEVVVAGDHLEITLDGVHEGRKVRATQRLPVPRVAARLEKPFQFLEPRRLSLDQLHVAEAGGATVERRRGAYPLRSGRRYDIVVRPQLPEVREVRMRDLPGAVHVLRETADPMEKSWKFLVEVSHKGTLSRPEQLFYDVVAPAERLTGEIPLCLRPPPWGHVRVALTVGIAATIQGFGVLFKWLAGHDYAFQEAWEGFRLGSDWPMLGVVSFPFVWGGLTLVDWLQYRLEV